MENKERVRQGLRRIGLSEYQSAVYLALIDHGPLAAVDLAEKSGIPGSRVYDVLTDLEHDGYVTTFEREDQRYAQANEPSDIVEILHQTSERLSETAENIENAWEQTSIVDHQINLVKQTESVIDRARDFVRSAEASIDIAATPSQYYKLRESLSTALVEDVVVRVSLESSSSNSIDTEQPVTELRRRTIPGPLLVIADRTYTCFAPNERTAPDYGLIVNDSIISFIFRWYFQLCLWSTCESIQFEPTDDRKYVNMEEFIRDIYTIWYSGGIVPVTIDGTDVDTGEACQITGVVSEIMHPNMSIQRDRVPTYSDLAGFVTLVVADENDEDHLIGSWGAVFEDIEAERITLHSSKIVLPPSLPARK